VERSEPGTEARGILGLMSVDRSKQDRGLSWTDINCFGVTVAGRKAGSLASRRNRFLQGVQFPNQGRTVPAQILPGAINPKD
jgi:hypothetical protein